MSMSQISVVYFSGAVFIPFTVSSLNCSTILFGNKDVNVPFSMSSPKRTIVALPNLVVHINIDSITYNLHTVKVDIDIVSDIFSSLLRNSLIFSKSFFEKL